MGGENFSLHLFLFYFNKKINCYKEWKKMVKDSQTMSKLQTVNTDRCIVPSWSLPIDLTQNMYYYGYTLENFNAKEFAENYKVIWPHIHTVYSMSTLNVGDFKGRFNESTIEIPRLLKIADKQGISEIVITDHDAPRMKVYNTNYSPLKGALKAQKMAKENEYKVKVIPGQEILFTPNDQKMAVHILLFPLTQEIAVKYKTGSIEYLADFCKDQNIKMVAPHPLAGKSMKLCEKTILFDPHIPKKIYHENIKYFDGLSVINALSFHELNKATLYATRDIKNIAKIGECDSHSYETLGLAGTLIPSDSAGIIEAIERKITIPFGAYGASRDLIYSWAINAYNLNKKYSYYLKKDSMGNYGDGFEIFKQIHGDKFRNQNALMTFIFYLFKILRYTAFPIAEFAMYHQNLRSILHHFPEIR